MSHPSSRARLALAIASVLCTSPAVFAIDRMWDEPAGGAFELPTNWEPEGAPEAGDVAIFNLGGTGYTVAFGADATSASLRVADTLTFDLGRHTYDVGSTIQVGFADLQSADLTVRNGSLVSHGTDSIGAPPGSAASLTLEGGASLTNVTGALRVAASGAGTFNLREGSRATVQSLTAGSGAVVGLSPSYGAVNVSGLGSMLTVNTTATIGEYGVAAFSVRDGGRLTTGPTTLGFQSSGQGSVLVSGPGSTWIANGRIDVGGGSGTITATQGARIQSNAAVRLGNTPTSSTTVMLSGTDTLWSHASAQFEVGVIGSASFTIADGASLSLVSGSFGASTGAPTSPSVTTLRVTGTGSTLKATQILNIGMFGETNVIVEAGGTLSAMGLFVGTSPAPGIANFSIDGAGSNVALTQPLSLNRQNVNITNGGTLVTGGANLAMVSPDSAVTVRVAGHGSNWTSSGQFQVGQSSGGRAEIYLEDGGQLTTTNLIIGGNQNAPGLVSVSGAGSRLRVTQTQNLMIGNQTNLPAELRVSDDGDVVSVARIQIAAAARLVLDGGNVGTTNNAPIENGGVIVHSGGTLSSGGAITNNGEIHLRAHDAIISANSIQNQRLIHGSGRINGNVTNTQAGEIRVAVRGERLAFGNQLLAGTVNNSGRVTLMDGGALEFNGQVTNNPPGVITFSGGGGSLHAPGAPVGGPPNGLTNFGQVLFSGGSSDFVGTLANGATTSKVIVTGNGTATFHGPVAHNDGEFRVSDGSTAVFLAPVTSGQGQFTGGGAKFFEGGQSQLGALTSGGDTTVQAPAGVKVSRFAEDALTVRGTFAVQPAETPTTNSLNLLTIIGDGVVDLANSDLLIDTDATTQDAVMAQVKQYIASARNSAAGEWQGPGLTSSAAAADALKTLALIASGDDVLVRYTYDGDANGDGKVNADDYFKIDSGFLAGSSNPAFSDGDFNYDNRINADDYFLIDSAFLGQGEAIAAGGVAAIVAVPEPGAIGLLALCGWVAIRRRR